MSKATRSAHRSARVVASERSGSKAGWIIGATIVVVIVVAAVIAIAVGSGDDDDAVPAGTEQVRPVTVIGGPLPQLGNIDDDPAVGRVAPRLTGQSFDGSPVAIEPGAPTLIVFLAHWCPHCRREVPLLVDWQRAGGVPEGLDVIGVATKTDATAPNYPPSTWLQKEAFPWPVMADTADSTAAVAMGLPGYPYFVLLDAEGEVCFRGSGEIETARLTQIIDSMLAA